MSKSEHDALVERVVEANKPWSEQAMMSVAATFGRIQAITREEIATIARAKAKDGFTLETFADLLDNSLETTIDLGKGAKEDVDPRVAGFKDFQKSTEEEVDGRG